MNTVSLKSKKELTSVLQQSIKKKGILDYIHSDLWDPSPIPFDGGARYMLTFIDDYSRKIWIYFLKHKNDVYLTFKQCDRTVI